MLEFLFGSKKKTADKYIRLNEIYSALREKYNPDGISEEKKTTLKKQIEKYGYLPMPHIKALEELSCAEVLYGLELKWEKCGIFKNGKFCFENDKISALARGGVKNSDWIKREGHNVKLINLAGLGNGNKTKTPGKFMDWLYQLLILPTGAEKNNILNTTVYLIPFHPREFGCAYLPKSSEVSEALLDKDLEELTGMNAKEQVQTFIMLAQLAGHPVIYDILPQTGRFSKAVLANPAIARWFDIEELIKSLKAKIDDAVEELSKEFDSDDVEVVKDIYKQALKNGAGDLTEHYQTIYNKMEEVLLPAKKELSNNMLKKANQIQIHKRVKTIVSDIHGFKGNKSIDENDITKQIDVIQELIKTGLWPAPGGAWCSAGVPVFDKMSECGGYPTFRHFDYKGDDVTNFANLDCQTPYYFAFLEDGTFNKPVIDYFINYMKQIQKDYNFDGFRVDHIDHIVDTVSEKDGKPISYRAPRYVLGRLNSAMKEAVPYFATLAEYMLWDGFLKEYHQDMNFDILWGNDIISQSDKTPEKITEDNQNLTNYNVGIENKKHLSILKTYNNQDGEFRCIDQYPGQLGEKGALYKWFKYKFLPGGKFAQRSMLYVDGDESYTQKGIEHVIGEEVSMEREQNYKFYAQFDAIDRFVKNNEIIVDGEAQIITQDDDGFAVWLITREPLKKAYLVVSNYNYPIERKEVKDENDECRRDWVEGSSVYKKTFRLPGDYTVEAKLEFDGENYIEKPFSSADGNFEFDELKPSEFRVFILRKQ